MRNRVLVCDDHEAVRDALSKFLVGKGYDVTEAKTGVECLELLKTHQFETIFLDIKLPDIDGLNVMEEIKRRGIGSQVILMSGVAVSGYGEFLSKPFHMDAVMSAINGKGRDEWKKLLVVDDEDQLRNLLKDYLIEKGYTITAVKNGKECVETLRENRFDAILMDVRMPEMDGIMALETLRKEGVRTPVVLMSGYGDICSVEDAQNKGAQDFLPKPFKLSEALRVLEGEL